MHIRRNRELLFTILGVILLLIMASYTVYALRFLSRIIAEALSGNQEETTEIRFELEALEPFFDSGKLKRISTPN